MNKKLLSAALASCAISVNAVPLNAQEDDASETQDLAFVCAVQEGTPTMFAYTQGKIDLKPLMSWHTEYLTPEQSGTEICQQTAEKLQDSYQQAEAKYLTAETSENNNLVCLANEEDQGCVADDSQKLFSVNSNYDAACIVENKNPLECKAIQARGIYSVGDEPYQPIWWPLW